MMKPAKGQRWLRLCNSRVWAGRCGGLQRRALERITTDVCMPPLPEITQTAMRISPDVRTVASGRIEMGTGGWLVFPVAPPRADDPPQHYRTFAPGPVMSTTSGD